MAAPSRIAPSRPVLGLIGLGAMGRPIARRLAQAGYPLHGFDLDPARLAAAAGDGLTPAVNGEEVVRRAEIVLTSLPSSEAFVRLAEDVLLPACRPGQRFVDLGTVTPPETRRLAARFAAREATLIDAPVSGGPQGAASGTLRIFIGGTPAVVEALRPLWEAIGDPRHCAYCGPAGSGQVVKGVNQLAMGLSAAAYLEAVAFGVRQGIDPRAIRLAVGETGDGAGWRGDLERIARRAQEGQAEQVGVKFRELPYYLREAAEQGWPLPLTRALYDFCDAGERVVVDDNRPAPSFWHELHRRRPAGDRPAPAGESASDRPAQAQVTTQPPST
jgi:3-hydroxyisobutyrate dehydrogenase-like beta-hydroxyacid dehydrogenase